MRRLCVLVVALALCAPPIFGQDLFDLSRAEIVRSPADVASWPATVQIANISIDANVGIAIRTAAPIPWSDSPDLSFPCPDNPGTSCGMGPLQYTVWVCVQPSAWKCAGFIQMWRTRAQENPNALPPLPSQWSLWWGPTAGGAANGDFGAYVPRAGDTIGMFLTSGDERNVNVTTVRERSNVVTFKLIAGDTASFDFAAPPAPEPPPAPIVTPPAPPIVTPAPPPPAPPPPAPPIAPPATEPTPTPIEATPTPEPVPMPIVTPPSPSRSLGSLLLEIIGGILGAALALIGVGAFR